MPPVVVAAGIGAAGAIGGGLLSASAQKKAAGQAADTSLAVADKNNALARENRDFSAARLDPYAQRGNEAGNAINALLGIAGTTSAPANAITNPGGQVGAVQPLPANANLLETWRQRIQTGQATIDQAPTFVRFALKSQGLGAGPMTTPPITAPANTASPTATYQNAFQNYLDSTGYQFQVDQGNKQITQGYAGRAALQSGAALQALQTYGQNTATGFFKDYLGLLANQQGVGLSGASAVAGVGQNYVNSVSANNNAAGTSAANAALAAGNANANLYGTIGGAIGGVANAWGSSYRPPVANNGGWGGWDVNAYGGWS